MTFIELLLDAENAPRHRILSSYIRSLTGFTVTDATDLEEKDPIPDRVARKIDDCGKLVIQSRIPGKHFIL